MRQVSVALSLLVVVALAVLYGFGSGAPEAPPATDASATASVPAPDAAAASALPASGGTGTASRPVAPQAFTGVQPQRLPLRYEFETTPERMRPLDHAAEPEADGAKTLAFARVVVHSAGAIVGDDMTVELAGLDAPDPEAACADARGRDWPCGRMGRAALARLIRSRAVECDVEERLGERRVRARCRVGRTDINDWVARQGWARAAPDAQDYAAAADAAREARSGLWR